jgi:hypothetical protein
MKLVSPSSADAMVAFGPTNIEALAPSNPEVIVTLAAIALCSSTLMPGLLISR